MKSVRKTTKLHFFFASKKSYNSKLHRDRWVNFFNDREKVIHHFLIFFHGLYGYAMKNFIFAKIANSHNPNVHTYIYILD